MGQQDITPLAAYLALNGNEGNNEFARRSGMDQGRVSLIRRGLKLPSPAEVLLIEAASNGKLKFENFYGSSVQCKKNTAA